jgi:hypothetical protein
VRATHLRQYDLHSEQSVKYALKFARQRCAIRKYAHIQVMLVADVRPGDLAYADTTDTSEQRGKENLLM